MVVYLAEPDPAMQDKTRYTGALPVGASNCLKKKCFFLSMTEDILSTEKPKSFGEIESEMNERGFTFVGREPLTRMFFTKDARFIAKPFRTREDLARAYVDRFQKQSGLDVEVELIDDTSLRENQKAVYIFAKKKE